MADTFYWYDLETTGLNADRDRVLQFAGQRTNVDLQPVGEPDSLLVRPAEDVIPTPESIGITGLSIAQLRREGISDFQLAVRMQQLFIRPGTCVVGFNNLSFDDEFVRRTLYRNLIDPYAREWQGGNSRWDLLELLRMTYALRPEGLTWPEGESGVSLRLEDLAKANTLAHDRPHDALSDVQATISLARLVHELQPRLFNWHLKLRDKNFVLAQLQPFLREPLLHVSAIYGRARRWLALLLPLCEHPQYGRQQVICLDLERDPRELLEADADTIRERTFSRADAAQPGFGLISLRCNRCPALAPLGVLQDSAGRELDLSRQLQHARLVAGAGEAVRQRLLAKVREVFGQPAPSLSDDPEDQLYSGGFFEDDDKRRLQRLHGAPETLLAAPLRESFRDPRLPELWFRARARNGGEELSEEEVDRWRTVCRQRLAASGRLQTFAEGLRQVRAEQTAMAGRLDELEDWVRLLVSRCGATLVEAD